MSNWLDILRAKVKEQGTKQTAKELGIARSSLSLALAGNYPASTKQIERKVLRMYGKDAILCPVAGAITPAQCAENWRKAKEIGLKAGNPETLRLYAECKRCEMRS